MSDLNTGWGFPPRFYNHGKDVGMVANEDDVRESLEILFSTAMNERLKFPDFGCDLHQFMFEEINRSLVIKIRQMIMDAVDYYEPRVTVQNITVTESEEDSHILLINIEYTINELNSKQNLIYPLSIY